MYYTIMVKGAKNASLKTQNREKNAPPTGDHVFQATGTNFELFYDDLTINMAPRVFTRKNATPPWRPYIIGTNHLTKFHDDRTINVASRVLTRSPWCNGYEVTGSIPTERAFFRSPPKTPTTETIFELIQDIIRTKLLTKFQEDRKINVASREYASPPGSHVFQPTSIIFELIQDIFGVNLLTKFHEDRTINVASRVKNAPPLGSHVFQANVTIFELFQDIIETNLPTEFHEDWTINVASRVLTRKTAPPPGGHFHDDWAKMNTSPPPGGHVFQRTGTIFELNQHILHEDVKCDFFGFSRGINGTNVLTKFHEDQTINVASRVFTRQNVDDARRTTHDARRTTDKKRSQKLTMSTLCSGELKTNGFRFTALRYLLSERTHFCTIIL
ncbi:hypothetical protein DPMN_088632 [Dreissena polymorpha]|uniref:Uncharacterized protein n=1 Tax=Dreissena polymorpha TaxID=45954 RepID=A0A9D4QXF9_DREPO|nr:hypothetical protein DPMN_088632 [Dreissena polymorpha]